MRLREETKPKQGPKEKIPNFPPLFGRPYWRRSKLFIHSYVVGFCGKIYPVVALSTIKHNDDFVFCFNLEQVDKFIEANFHKKEIEDYYTPPKNRWNGRNWGDINRKGFGKCFAEFDKKKDAYVDFFEEKKCPIFIRDYHKGVIVYNGCLKELEFYRVIEPYTAFQEIAMFWGGMAQPNRSVPSVSDCDLVIAKGFNKHSFRKDKKNPKIKK